MTLSFFLGALFLLGVPVLTLAAGVLSFLRDRRAHQDVKLQEAERKALQEPMPGTLTVTGRVLGPYPPQTVQIVKRRQFGCLGGPLVYLVPPFQLELADGSRASVDVGPDPRVENEHLLIGPPPPLPPAPRVADQPFPVRTGAPDAIFALFGRVRVEGVVRDGDCLRPPRKHSAVLTIISVEP